MGLRCGPETLVTDCPSQKTKDLRMYIIENKNVQWHKNKHIILSFDKLTREQDLFYILSAQRYVLVRSNIWVRNMRCQGQNWQSINSFFLTGIGTYVTMISAEKVFLWRLDSPVVVVKASRCDVCSCARILQNALNIKGSMLRKVCIRLI